MAAANLHREPWVILKRLNTRATAGLAKPELLEGADKTFL